MTQAAVNKRVLLGLLILISGLFVYMIRQFLMPIFLAGIFAALMHPFFRRLLQWMGGRRNLAALAALLLFVLVLLIPMAGLLGVVTAQAIKVSQSVTPWVQANLAQPTALSDLLERIPFYDRFYPLLEPYKEAIITKAGQAVGVVSKFLIDSISSATLGTVNFLFMLFIFLFAMFYFFNDGKRLLDKMLYYLPLEDQDERRILDRFTSVARATLKGTAVIGLLQGGLAGLAFSVAGIPSAVFWGTLMSLLSVLPGIGTALVWAPAVIMLAAAGHWLKAVLLAVFCGLVVGSLDNFLRPRLVGKDTEMHDLLILFSTLGGISMFGLVGFMIGPILAALFVTIWDIYAVTFKDILPRVAGATIEAGDEAADEGPEDEAAG